MPAPCTPPDCGVSERIRRTHSRASSAVRMSVYSRFWMPASTERCAMKPRVCSSTFIIVDICGYRSAARAMFSSDSIVNDEY